MSRHGRRWLGWVALGALGIGLLGLLLEGTGGSLAWPTPRPAKDYAEAIARFAALSKFDGPAVNPVCRSRLFTHGTKTARAVVLLHGFTNCPRQFESLGSILYAAGANVLLPRAPHHGLRDRMTGDLARLTENELVEASASALDIARGLGDTVIVVGLSTTGVAAAALAERRADLGRAILLAPAIVPRGIPASIGRSLAALMIGAPNLFVWWDSKAKQSLSGPTQCYPRFPTRALGQVYRLGARVLDEAARRPPAARAIVVITTQSDRAVDNEAIAELASRWRRHGAAVIEYQFPESLRVLHDMVDPEQVGARPDAVYPVVAALALGRPLP